MARGRTQLIAALTMASFPWPACSPSAPPPHDGATDGPGLDAGSGPYDPNGPYAACNDPLSQTSRLLGDGFAPWEDLSALGCFNSSEPVKDAACDDATVTGGAIAITASICTGNGWEVFIFDGTRGLNCKTTRGPIDRVFTLTPADCACASAGREVSAGCADEADGGAGSDAGQETQDASDE